jgi:spore coat polysaccharide biosynthesis predicted glycosyltransferase SpsG
MAALMARADLAVGAGGTTSWERCCLGLPTVMITVADNQALIARHLAAAGAVELLGPRETVTPEAVATALRTFHETPERRHAMGLAAAAVCDGAGADRLCGIIRDREKAA